MVQILFPIIVSIINVVLFIPFLKDHAVLPSGENGSPINVTYKRSLLDRLASMNLDWLIYLEIIIAFITLITCILILTKINIPKIRSINQIMMVVTIVLLIIIIILGLPQRANY